MKYFFDFDLSKCTNCGACAVACMDHNDLFPEKGDEPYRKCCSSETGHGFDTTIQYFSVSCMHCYDAACIAVCPNNCFSKDAETGFVLLDSSNCTGCGTCLKSCPLEALGFNRYGKISKCDGCLGRVNNGLEPACVRICPFGALNLIREDDYDDEKRIKTEQTLIKLKQMLKK